MHDAEAFEREFEAFASEQIEAEMMLQQEEKKEEIRPHMEQNPQAEEISQGAREAMHDITEESAAIERSRQEEHIDGEFVGMERTLMGNGILPPGESSVETMRAIPENDIADRIQQNQPQQLPLTEVDEQLAQTAGMLLNNVADDQSEKFKNSKFLNLMRQFRDYEKKVDGDQVVDVASNEVCSKSEMGNRYH